MDYSDDHREHHRMDTTVTMKTPEEAMASLTVAYFVLDTMQRKGWWLEDTEKSKDFFPKGSFNLVVEELQKVAYYLEAEILKKEKKK